MAIQPTLSDEILMGLRFVECQDCQQPFRATPNAINGPREARALACGHALCLRCIQALKIGTTGYASCPVCHVHITSRDPPVIKVFADIAASMTSIDKLSKDRELHIRNLEQCDKDQKKLIADLQNQLSQAVIGQVPAANATTTTGVPGASGIPTSGTGTGSTPSTRPVARYVDFHSSKGVVLLELRYVGSLTNETIPIHVAEKCDALKLFIKSQSSRRFFTKAVKDSFLAILGYDVAAIAKS